MPTPNQEAYYNRLRKLTPEQITAIREAFSLPLPQRPTLQSLAKQYNVSKNLIFRIVHTNG